MISVENLMDYLYERRTQNLPAEGLAEVFDRLIWCMNDQGKEVLQVRMKWLEGTDVERVRIALAMNEVFPCQKRDDMVDLLSSIVARWPEFEVKCQAILKEWDQQMGKAL